MRPLFLLPECVPYLSLQIDDEQPPTKMKKLAIMEEREEDKYEHTLTIRCWLCEPTGGMPIPDAYPRCLARFESASQSRSLAETDI